MLSVDDEWSFLAPISLSVVSCGNDGDGAAADGIAFDDISARNSSCGGVSVSVVLVPIVVSVGSLEHAVL